MPAPTLFPDRAPGIRPRLTPWRRLDAAARRALPLGFATVMVLLLAAPLHLPAQPELLLGVELASVFYWTLFRPASMPAFTVFLLGLLIDLMGSGPLGLTVVLLLIAHGLAMAWRHGLARQGFFVIWLVFAGLAAGASLLQWGVSSLMVLRLLPVLPPVLQTVLAIGVYPVLAVPFGRAHHGVADPARA